jgi:hypothetical protein
MENIDEITTSETGKEMSDTDTDYVAAIQKLQKETVSKELYEKLRAERSQLINALASGQTIEVEKDEPEIDIDSLRKKLFKGNRDLSNYEYVDSVLKLRKALMDKGEPDPFLPIGDKVTVDADMISKAENVAAGLQHCIDLADGDSNIFTAQLQRITKEALPMRRAR